MVATKITRGCPTCRRAVGTSDQRISRGESSHEDQSADTIRNANDDEFGIWRRFCSLLYAYRIGFQRRNGCLCKDRKPCWCAADLATNGGVADFFRRGFCRSQPRRILDEYPGHRVGKESLGRSSTKSRSNHPIHGLERFDSEHDHLQLCPPRHCRGKSMRQGIEGRRHCPTNEKAPRTKGRRLPARCVHIPITYPGMVQDIASRSPPKGRTDPPIHGRRGRVWEEKLQTISTQRILLYHRDSHMGAIFRKEEGAAGLPTAQHNDATIS
mmetsp:Transcript_32730/g.77168  ORF Transcript_32730/g.77168 Transcript_32730/m.77168 type:complete len:269 (+) Transcript_32730:674-1480(+)